MLALIPTVAMARPPKAPKPDVKAERDALKKALKDRDADILDLRQRLDVMRHRERAMMERFVASPPVMRMPPPVTEPPLAQPPSKALVQAQLAMREQVRMMHGFCTCTPARGDVLRRQFSADVEERIDRDLARRQFYGPGENDK